jgi:hypothetical protein
MAAQRAGYVAEKCWDFDSTLFNVLAKLVNDIWRPVSNEML